MLSIIERLFSSLWRVVTMRDLWSGLIPTVALGLLAFYGLRQTNQQLTFMSEEISYIRQPVLFLEARPDFARIDSDGPQGRLFLSNVGNEPAENVNLRLQLLLATDSQVYSYGQHQDVRSYFTDSTRTAKEMIWPRLILPPDSQIEITDKLYHELLTAYHTKPVSGKKELRGDLITMLNSFGGDYVLFAECSYRRPVDFETAADTGWFLYDPIWGVTEPLVQKVGGPGIIERAKKYLQHGPQFSINIQSDHYEIYQHKSSRMANTIKMISRPKVEN